MLQNTFFDQALDQASDQEPAAPGPPAPLVLMAWEQDRHASAPFRRISPDLYTVAVVLLLLLSLAAILACFARMN